MMIDEAIEQEKFKARVDRIKANKRIFHNNDEDEISACHRSAEEHEQLAEWLEELKDYRDKNKMVVRIDIENIESVKDKINKLSKEQYNKGYEDGRLSVTSEIRNKAIDDFSKWLVKHKIVDEDSMPEIIMDFNEEQIKAGGENEQRI